MEPMNWHRRYEEVYDHEFIWETLFIFEINIFDNPCLTNIPEVRKGFVKEICKNSFELRADCSYQDKPCCMGDELCSIEGHFLPR